MGFTAVMNFADITKQLHQFWQPAYDWLQQELFVADTLLQLALLLVGLFLAWFMAKPIRRKLDKYAQSASIFASSTVQMVLYDVLLPVLWLILLTVTIFALQNIDVSTQFLEISSTLMAAWVAIRFFSILVRNHSLSRFITVIAWIIAAMSIIGWLEPTINFLDGLDFNLGELRISVLTIIKGFITLGILLWAAVAISNITEKQIRNLTGLTPSLQVLFSKLIKIVLISFALLIGVSSVGIDITALAVFSGAVGVGIGFGLQKIVSNFISGVILLLDRSIKPGDVIEVDDTYGWINRLSARHVSVITRDGKEHLIPNEDLITQRVINWSYSSKAVRLKIPIGVSYQSDIHLAKKLMLEAADEVPRVLANPVPTCLLTGFGDNSVNLELRLWIEDPSNGVSNVRSQILFMVWDKFQQHNIEIPFPQRDVHLDISPELIDALSDKLLNQQRG